MESALELNEPTATHDLLSNRLKLVGMSCRRHPALPRQAIPETRVASWPLLHRNISDGRYLMSTRASLALPAQLLLQANHANVASLLSHLADPAGSVPVSTLKELGIAMRKWLYWQGRLAISLHGHSPKSTPVSFLMQYLQLG